MEISPLRQLRMGKLPKMVSWYDPRLLARIGVRTIISTVFGQYADQRLMQAVTDPCDDKELCARYDYQRPECRRPATSASRSTTAAPSGSTTSPTSATASSRPTPPPTCWRRTASTCAVPASFRTATS